MKKQLTIWLCFIMFGLSAHVIAQSNPLPEGLPPSRISFKVNNKTVYIPYWRNLAIGTRRTNITNAIIAFHGVNQYGKSVYDNLRSAAISEGQLNNSLIVSPIMMELDHMNYHNLDKNTYAYWTRRWKFGDLSQNSNRVSSFTVIDKIVEILLRNNPNLKTLTITGFSAGGQMINRYAAGSRVSIPSNVKVQYVSYAPSIYLYPDSRRRISGSENRFRTPSTNCSNYNKYEFGINGNLNSYMRATGATAIKRNLTNRTVYQMIGERDTGTRYLDVRCGAKLQGDNRYQRARIYTNYVRRYYMRNDNKKLLVARGYGHSAGAYKARNVRKVFFASSRRSKAFDVHEFDKETSTNEITVYPNPASNRLHLSGDSKNTSYSIFNPQGKMVRKGINNAPEITIEDLQPGMYFIQIKTDTFTTQKTFIKN
ncbi:T9SS type A sorting domain-containing protein [Aquimarina sp. TRL1]|uniref:T9SS type A sorting domain-containing protein n=1 Tax=Aquimarina sp. (strain TRL1) TaxID=2736252 RepID=UPI00158AC6DC|nr:T9SS type A sorting domain-containing protein [Aquimarina sp. TRL1]QKX03496.1 T9SS type A sorting domain-containing protein [Aquimarina sp. TRL1]